LTDSEVMELSGLSRSTVWRALDQLGREGWLDRQIGRGTFAGVRVSMPQSEPTDRQIEADDPYIRLAISVFYAGQWADDWYTPLVLQGIDDVVDSREIRVELLGMQNNGPQIMSRRLSNSNSDVLACLSSGPKSAMLIRDAQRLDIPTIAVSTDMASFGANIVCEDNHQGMELAVSHLVERGHRRIGLIMQTHSQEWVMQRYYGYMHAIEKSGLTFDAGLALLLEATQLYGDDQEIRQKHIQRVEKFILKEKPTAIIVGHFFSIYWLAAAVRNLDMHIPGDLSIIGVD
jgi:DNA-binding LacI/PurR family transcriptional regulator